MIDKNDLRAFTRDAFLYLLSLATAYVVLRLRQFARTRDAGHGLSAGGHRQLMELFQSLVIRSREINVNEDGALAALGSFEQAHRP